MKVAKTKAVPERVLPAREMEYDEEYCDGCGKLLDEQSTEEDCLHELYIFLDRSRCVSFTRTREYCPACLKPVWDAISKLIGADPDLIGRDRDYD